MVRQGIWLTARLRSGVELSNFGVRRRLHARDNVTIMILERHVYWGVLRRVRRDGPRPTEANEWNFQRSDRISYVPLAVILTYLRR